MPVNTGLVGRGFGDARFTRGSGQVWWRGYDGFAVVSGCRRFIQVKSAGMKILFVCMGNICRSPTAEGVFRALAEQAGLERALTVRSAGVGAYHVGEAPDMRAQAAARRRGYDISQIRARQVEASDFENFDLILAMDAQVLSMLERRAGASHRHKIHPYMRYARSHAGREVPDPYYGGPGGFERVLDLIEDVSQGLLARYG